MADLSGLSDEQLSVYRDLLAKKQSTAWEQHPPAPPNPTFPVVDYPHNQPFGVQSERRPFGAEPQEVTQTRTMRHNKQGMDELGGLGMALLPRAVAGAPLRTMAGIGSAAGTEYGLRKAGLPGVWPEVAGTAVGMAVGGPQVRDIARRGIRGLFGLSNESALPMAEMKAAVRGGRMSIDDFTTALVKSGKSQDQADMIAGNLRAAMQPKPPAPSATPEPFRPNPNVAKRMRFGGEAEDDFSRASRPIARPNGTRPMPGEPGVRRTEVQHFGDMRLPRNQPEPAPLFNPAGQRINPTTGERIFKKGR